MNCPLLTIQPAILPELGRSQHSFGGGGELLGSQPHWAFELLKKISNPIEKVIN